MFLPVGAAFRALTRTVEFRTVFAGAIEFRTLAERTVTGGAILARLVVARFVKTRLVEIPRTVTRAGIAFATIIALLPRLGIAALRPIAEILARATVGGATGGELLGAAKFSLGTIAVARRPRTVRAIAARPVAVLAETFAARGIGPLFTVAVARRVRLFIAEFSVGRSRGRAGVVAVATIEVRPVAARRVRALVAATVFARLERTLLAVAVIARPKILPRPTVAAVALAIRTIASGTVVAIESRRPRRVAKIPARRTIVTIAGVRLAPARIGLLAIGFVAVAFAGKAALGEFLLRSTRCAGAALAAGRAVTPAAGIVVFIIIAGHECLS